MKTFLSFLMIVLLAGPLAAEEGTEGKGILDFATPPMPLAPTRLVGLDGKNIDGQGMRTSWWVEPGDHEITVVAIIDNPMGDMDPLAENLHVGGTDPGKTTITVEAGKRYKIAAQVKDNKGDWEPVLYKVEDIK